MQKDKSFETVLAFPPSFIRIRSIGPSFHPMIEMLHKHLIILCCRTLQLFYLDYNLILHEFIPYFHLRSFLLKLIRRCQKIVSGCHSVLH